MSLNGRLSVTRRTITFSSRVPGWSYVLEHGPAALTCYDETRERASSSRRLA